MGAGDRTGQDHVPWSHFLLKILNIRILSRRPAGQYYMRLIPCRYFWDILLCVILIAGVGVRDSLLGAFGSLINQ
jgi:hypothetical protein